MESPYRLCCLLYQKMTQQQITITDDESDEDFWNTVLIELQNIDVTSALHESCQEGDDELVEFLIDNGADIFGMGKFSGLTPLDVAVENVHMNVVKVLLRAGVDVNSRTQKYFGKTQEEGWTPLHRAVLKQDAAIVKQLLKYGADVNARTEMTGNTPLHFALKVNADDIVTILLKRGLINVNIKNIHHETPLHIATINGMITSVSLLLTHDANVYAEMKDWKTALHNVATITDCPNVSKMATMLIEKGADVSAIDMDGATPLHLAVKNNNYTMAKILLGEAANVDMKMDCGQNALILSVISGSLEMCQLFIDEQADVNEGDILNLTALHYAARKNNIDIARILLENGADATIKCSNGKTPLCFAVDNNFDKMVKLLKSYVSRSK